MTKDEVNFMKSLYMHIPFCRKKCSYCDFASYPGSDGLIPDYLSALEREVASIPNLKFQISTVFIGGGTPSLLSAEQIKQLLGLVSKYFDCSNLREITFESNPESLAEDKLKVLIGFNKNIRLSIGLQSFDDNELQALGRIHSTADFTSKYLLARKLGFKNINADLIYGIPGQTAGGWQKNLRKLIELKPEHISAYCLTIADGTPFAKNGVVVDDELTAQMYRDTMELLSASGYQHYEISNFALSGRECLHNKTYWRNEEYIGLGCSAVSYINGARRKNTSDLKKYITDAGTSRICEEIDQPGTESKLSESIMLGLRMCSGMDLTPEISNKYGDVINRFVRDGYMGLEDNRFFITPKGFFISNQILTEFF